MLLPSARMTASLRGSARDRLSSAARSSSTMARIFASSDPRSDGDRALIRLAIPKAVPCRGNRCAADDFYDARKRSVTTVRLEPGPRRIASLIDCWLARDDRAGLERCAARRHSMPEGPSEKPRRREQQLQVIELFARLKQFGAHTRCADRRDQFG